MRSGLILSVVLLAVVIAFGVWAEGAVTAQSDRYISASHELLALSASGDWARAGQLADDYSARLRETTPWLCTLIDHAEVEQLSAALTDLRAALSAQNADDSIYACYRLEAAASRIKERNQLTPENIL